MNEPRYPPDRMTAGEAPRKAEWDAWQPDRAPGEVETVARAFIGEDRWERMTTERRAQECERVRVALDAVRSGQEQARDDTVTELARRLPKGYQPIGDDPKSQAFFGLSYDAGDEVWEVEFCALDPARNFTLQDRSLDAVLRRALEREVGAGRAEGEERNERSAGAESQDR